jgi:hypothetical protein
MAIKAVGLVCSSACFKRSFCVPASSVTDRIAISSGLNNFLKFSFIEICNADPNVGAAMTTFVPLFAILILSFHTCSSKYKFHRYIKKERKLAIRILIRYCSGLFQAYIEL